MACTHVDTPTPIRFFRLFSSPHTILKRRVEQMDRSQARKLVREAGELLSRLGVAEPGTFVIKEGHTFRLFGDRNKVVETAIKAWYRSLSELVNLVGRPVLGGLLDWIQKKQQSFENALINKVALHFDILLLGIVSTSGRLSVTLS